MSVTSGALGAAIGWASTGGAETVGKVKFGPGDIRFAKAGAGYGPIRIGPEGCTVVIVFQEATGAMTLPVGKAKALAEVGQG